jgi:transcription initiation factor TFIIB
MGRNRGGSTPRSGADAGSHLAIIVIQTYAERLNLPRSVLETAVDIYRRAAEARLVMGRPIEVLAAASVYAACRIYGIPRRLRDFAAVRGTPNKKEVAQGYRILLQHLGLRPPIPDPLSYVNRIALRLSLDSTVVSEAYKILDEASVRGVVVGKDPAGVAAAVLYIASRKLNRSGQVWEDLREKDLAEAAGVAELTVKHRLQELENLFRERIS